MHGATRWCDRATQETCEARQALALDMRLAARRASRARTLAAESMTSSADRRFISAAGHDWLLPFYDAMHRLFIGNGPRTAVIAAANIQADQSVLDIGCGTGTQAIELKKTHPTAQVTAIDPDPKALLIAQRKSGSATAVTFDRGFADDLPYPDGSFDCVFSSFMLHHLTHDVKVGTLRSVLRVLRPGGSFHILDLGQPKTTYSSIVARLLFRGDHFTDNVSGRIPALMSEGGFVDCSEKRRWFRVFGPISHYAGTKPSSG